MNGKICCLWVSLLWFAQLAQGSRQHIQAVALTYQPPYLSINKPGSAAKTHYAKSLRFNVYTFAVSAADSGRVRNLLVKAYRGELLLTAFRIRVDGAVVGADVADLDHNRFPELYVYSTSDGSGSFGRVYAWQFLPERKAEVTLANWRNPSMTGYMGHDSLWIERDILCRKFPVYRSGDANAGPSGGFQLMRYKLQPEGSGFLLIAE